MGVVPRARRAAPRPPCVSAVLPATRAERRALYCAPCRGYRLQATAIRRDPRASASDVSRRPAEPRRRAWGEVQSEAGGAPDAVGPGHGGCIHARSGEAWRELLQRGGDGSDVDEPSRGRPLQARRADWPDREAADSPSTACRLASHGPSFLTPTTILAACEPRTRQNRLQMLCCLSLRVPAWQTLWCARPSFLQDPCVCLLV